ncbi:MAG: cysteine-rich VLP protein [Clostridia bacterium]|nr:cysteine-rich VLP protein [Clostridia bacterium]
MLRITPKQARTVHRLARDQCCNCVDGNCLLSSANSSCWQICSGLSPPNCHTRRAHTESCPAVKAGQ